LISQPRRTTMSEAPMGNLCIHTATTRPLPIELATEAYAAAGVAGITVWRDALAGRDPVRVGESIRAAGLTPVALCRGGFFVSPDQAARAAAVADNEQAIREAAALGASMVVLVCGADPAVELPQARDQIVAGIQSVVPLAEELNVQLAIEPLHPMYADSRSAVNTMRSANDMAERIGHRLVGVAVDVYHVWWDPELEDQISRCGDRIFAFHVCDWRTPTRDLLNDRGLMGDGCIPIPKIRGWVEAAGFTGFNEVEIFSTERWAQDQISYVNNIVDAYRRCV
jgi:sugar phosphate isomerase/epimerase